MMSCNITCDFYHGCDGYCDGKLDNVTSPEMIEWREWLVRIGYKIGKVDKEK